MIRERRCGDWVERRGREKKEGKKEEAGKEGEKTGGRPRTQGPTDKRRALGNRAGEERDGNTEIRWDGETERKKRGRSEESGGQGRREGRSGGRKGRGKRIGKENRRE